MVTLSDRCSELFVVTAALTILSSDNCIEVHSFDFGNECI